MKRFRCVECGGGFVEADLHSVLEDGADNGVGVCHVCHNLPSVKKWQANMFKAGWRRGKGGVYTHKSLLLGHELTIPACAVGWWQGHGVVPQIRGTDG